MSPEKKYYYFLHTHTSTQNKKKIYSRISYAFYQNASIHTHKKKSIEYKFLFYTNTIIIEHKCHAKMGMKQKRLLLLFNITNEEFNLRKIIENKRKCRRNRYKKKTTTK